MAVPEGYSQCFWVGGTFGLLDGTNGSVVGCMDSRIPGPIHEMPELPLLCDNPQTLPSHFLTLLGGDIGPKRTMNVEGLPDVGVGGTVGPRGTAGPREKRV